MLWYTLCPFYDIRLWYKNKGTSVYEIRDSIGSQNFLLARPMQSPLKAKKYIPNLKCPNNVGGGGEFLTFLWHHCTCKLYLPAVHGAKRHTNTRRKGNWKLVCSFNVTITNLHLLFSFLNFHNDNKDNTMWFKYKKIYIFFFIKN